MKPALSLSKLSDHSLLADLFSLVKKSNALTAELLAYLGEVDRRRLYLQEACPSMHAYCVERLHLSDGAAYKRIHAARAAGRFPALLKMLERGEIHPKGITLLAAHLTEENHREILKQARHSSTRQIERLVAELAPKPDTPSRVAALPRPRASAAPTRQGPAAAPRTAAPRGMSPALSRSTPPGPTLTPDAGERGEPGPRPGDRRPTVVTPLAPRRYEIRVTVGEQAYADLAQLQDLLSHQISGGDPAEILSQALALLLERTLAQKAAVTDRPRKARPQAKRSRHIPAEVRRQVWLRDQGRCAFRDARGRRCRCTRKLEYHHLDNWAQVPEHATDRIELRCRAHNAYQARLDYGAAFIQAAIDAKNSAREAPAAYFPRPGPAARASSRRRSPRGQVAPGARGALRGTAATNGGNGSGDLPVGGGGGGVGRSAPPSPLALRAAL